MTTNLKNLTLYIFHIFFPFDPFSFEKHRPWLFYFSFWYFSPQNAIVPSFEQSKIFLLTIDMYMHVWL